MNWKKIVVAGGGVLGSQIAFQTAFSGFDAKIWLRSEGSIGRTQPKVDRLKDIYLKTIDALKENPALTPRGFGITGEITDEVIADLKDRVNRAYESLVLTTDYNEAFKDADFVIESIAEDPKQKIAFYTEMAKYLPDHTVIATNSSTMLPSTFASYTGRPEKYLALHFANEIWRNNTGEIMGHAGTEKIYYDQTVEFTSAIHMVPLKLHKEQPGYILNSMLVPFLNAAEALFANGVADPETIDKTWMLGTGAPAGPFRILDVVGLTTAYNIVIMDPRSKDPETIQGKVAGKLKEYIDAGKTGVNAGEGFYKYK